MLITTALLVATLPAFADETVTLDRYSCKKFLEDVKAPSDGIKLLRSLMMVSWAAGYAAAYQKGTPRADVAAVQIASAVLGDVCRKQPEKTAVLAIAEAVAKLADASPAPQASASPSRWDQNGSVVYLTADGPVRKFVFEAPSDAMASVGVQKNSLFFDGRKIGQKYSGTLYAFYGGCKPQGYQVAGEVSADEKTVTLHGRAPLLDATCKYSGARDAVSVFTFIPPKS